MNDGKLTIDLSGVGNDIPTKLGKSRPTLTNPTMRSVSHSLAQIVPRPISAMS